MLIIERLIILKLGSGVVVGKIRGISFFVRVEHTGMWLWACIALVNSVQIIIVVHNFVGEPVSSTVEINHSKNYRVHLFFKVLGYIEFVTEPAILGFIKDIFHNDSHLRLG